MCVIRHHPYADSWPQDAAEQPAAVLATIVTPESRVAMPLTGITATDTEVIDGRPPPAPVGGLRRCGDLCLHSARGEKELIRRGG